MSMSTSWQEFLEWESSSIDTIDVKKDYIDMAGDIVSGVLLSQIVYWHLPTRRGESKLFVQHDGEYWIAKARDDWHAECRVSAKQFDRAIAELESRNLVVTSVHKFGEKGVPIKHVRINRDVFITQYGIKRQARIDNYGKSTLPKQESRDLPSGNVRIAETSQSSYAGTEDSKTTPKTTAESVRCALDGLKPSQLPDTNKSDHNSRMVRPTLQEVGEYTASLQGSIQDDAEDYFDHFSGNGWKTGRNPIVDWKAAARRWVREARRRRGDNGEAFGSYIPPSGPALPDGPSAFYAAFLAKHNEPPVINYRHTNELRTLGEALTIEVLQRRITNYFDSTVEYVRRSDWSVRIFLKDPDEWINVHHVPRRLLPIQESANASFDFLEELDRQEAGMSSGRNLR